MANALVDENRVTHLESEPGSRVVKAQGGGGVVAQNISRRFVETCFLENLLKFGSDLVETRVVKSIVFVDKMSCYF